MPAHLIDEPGDFGVFEFRGGARRGQIRAEGLPLRAEGLELLVSALALPHQRGGLVLSPLHRRPELIDLGGGRQQVVAGCQFELGGALGIGLEPADRIASGDSPALGICERKLEIAGIVHQARAFRLVLAARGVEQGLDLPDARLGRPLDGRAPDEPPKKRQDQAGEKPCNNPGQSGREV